jgi:hypothetical protein
MKKACSKHTLQQTLLDMSESTQEQSDFFSPSNCYFMCFILQQMHKLAGQSIFIF